MRLLIIILIIQFSSINLFSQQALNEIAVVSDIDGNYYRVVTIGKQMWFGENLRVTRYSDGTYVPTGLNNVQWQNTKIGAYSVYHLGTDPDAENHVHLSTADMVEAYGKLYNWFAVSDSRGLCPRGWRVPTAGDWDQLINYLIGGFETGGNQLKSPRQVGSNRGGPFDTKQHPRWDAVGAYFDQDVYRSIGEFAINDEYGFSALPAGSRDTYGQYSQLGGYAYFWSSTPASGGDAYSQLLFAHLSDILKMPLSKQHGLSVRCVKINE